VAQAIALPEAADYRQQRDCAASSTNAEQKIMLESGARADAAIDGKAKIPAAYPAERDRPFRPKVISGSGDRDHAVHGARGPA
jgi:hypothetical protein